jgi:hypothetical protein
MFAIPPFPQGYYLRGPLKMHFSFFLARQVSLKQGEDVAKKYGVKIFGDLRLEIV